ncbi:MAG: superoxide dismutase family protein [Dokdonella sp.]
MKRQNLHFAIIAGLAMAASIAGCTPDQKGNTPAAPAPMAAEPVAPAPPPVVSAPAEIPAGHAVVSLQSVADMKVSGDLTLTAEAGGVHISGTINGLTPGTQHGFHIHETGDCSAADFKSAGGHFNPSNMQHGNPSSDMHHAGDMMNLAVNDSGSATLDVTVPGVTLGDGGTDDVMSRAIVIHAGPDDYTSQPAGDSGSRIACGVIAK